MTKRLTVSLYFGSADDVESTPINTRKRKQPPSSPVLPTTEEPSTLTTTRLRLKTTSSNTNTNTNTIDGNQTRSRKKTRLSDGSSSFNAVDGERGENEDVDMDEEEGKRDDENGGVGDGMEDEMKLGRKRSLMSVDMRLQLISVLDR